MEWFEYIIMAVAIFLVLLPLILKIANRKNPHKSSCGCDCGENPKCECCMTNFMAYIKEATNNK